MSKYRVESNDCTCHPETCCCDDYAVYTGAYDKVATVSTREAGEKFIRNLENRKPRKRKQRGF